MARITLAFTLAIIGWWMQSGPVVRAAGEPLCRFGINVSSFPDRAFYVDDFDIAPLRAGWYVDYRATPSPPANNGAAYAMVMGVWDNGRRDDAGRYGYGPTGASLDKTVAAHPGGIYIVGNEPDRRVLQHDVLPENYARIYHDAYAEIKAKDPAAKVWAGAIVQPTPLRLAYLDKVLATYRAEYGEPMPVDGWAIHAFILNEASCAYYEQFYPGDPIGLSNECWGADIPPGDDATDGERRKVADNARTDLFTQGIWRFRSWMAQNGYRQTPLYVTEYGVLMPPEYGFPPETVNRFMRQTFDFMLDTTDPDLGYSADGDRLVQRFAWFSTVDPEFNGNLYESARGSDPLAAPFKLSKMGEHFRDYASQEQATSDLALMQVEWLDASGQLMATVANQGNRMTPTYTAVHFYAGETRESATLIGEAMTKLAGCGETATATLAWPHAAPPNMDQLFVRVAEADLPRAAFLPLVR